MPRSLDEYQAARRKIDDTVATLTARAGEALRCRSGCAACCEVDLAVSTVEAESVRVALGRLPAAARERVRARADTPSIRCVMLDEDDRCAIYVDRPFVCRTQGLPLRYPAGTVPVAAVRRRTAGGDVTVCPLNFPGEDPTDDQTLDAERVDVLLGVVDHRHRDGAQPARIALRTLAAER